MSECSEALSALSTCFADAGADAEADAVGKSSNNSLAG